MRFAISSILCTFALTIVGCGAADPAPDTGPDESGAGGSTATTTTGAGGSGATAGSGAGGGVGTAGTMSSGGPSGSGGSGSVGAPPGMPTGTLASSWLGFQAPDVVTGTNLV